MCKTFCAYAYFVEAIKSLNSLKRVPTIGYIYDIHLFVWSVWSEPDILGSMCKILCAYAYFVEAIKSLNSLKRVPTIGYIYDIDLFVWSVWSEPDILGSMCKTFCAYAYFVEVSELYAVGQHSDSGYGYTLLPSCHSEFLRRCRRYAYAVFV